MVLAAVDRIQSGANRRFGVAYCVYNCIRGFVSADIYARNLYKFAKKANFSKKYSKTP